MWHAGTRQELLQETLRHSRRVDERHGEFDGTSAVRAGGERTQSHVNLPTFQHSDHPTAVTLISRLPFGEIGCYRVVCSVFTTNIYI
jgi:hypothetical protein